MSLAFWTIIQVSQTTGYVGLPFEPKPTFLDCYQQAVWDGSEFVESGHVICLGEGRP